jgi:hypothetical protein
MNGVIEQRRGSPIALNGTNDHVHILARFAVDESLAEIIKHVKSWLERLGP